MTVEPAGAAVDVGDAGVAEDEVTDDDVAASFLPLSLLR